MLICLTQILSLFHRDFPGDSEARFYFVMKCTKDFWLIMSTPAGKTQIKS